MAYFLKKKLLLGFVVGGFSCFALANDVSNVGIQETDSQMNVSLSDPVAIVDGREISKEELNAFSLVVQGVSIDELQDIELVKQLLQHLGRQYAIADIALKRGLDGNKKYQYRVQVMKALFLDDILLEEMVDKGDISKAQIKAQYDLKISQHQHEEYLVSHILVETSEEALRILKAMQDQEITFQQAVAQYCIDENTRENEGSWGSWFPLRVMDPAVSEALEHMDIGAMSPSPIKSEVGYHILILDGKREAELPALETLDSQVILELAKPAYQEFTAPLKDKVHVKILGQDE